MDTNQWTQEIVGLKGMEEITSTTCIMSRPVVVQERKVRPQKEQALNCPRCHSTNTKFCYYNNYSLTQPRYFCKTCRRYWTEGGTLRNVPVGGGSRKNKRSTTTTTINASTSSSFHKLPADHLMNPTKIHDEQDLKLAFPPSQGQYYHHGGSPQFFELTKIDSSSSNQQLKSSTPFAALDLLRSTGIVSRGMTSTTTAPAPALYSSSGFSFQDLKPASISFSVDHHGLGSRFVPSGIQENGGRIMFPFGVMKQLQSTNEADHNKGQPNTNSNGYWNGMLGGGSW
ncbi:hypothetical protein ACH5RR_000051 [Cinchona calisaya]|uniref:Dof zinc finger protein n=1 Tax=Cinchona calisaya TaxID=153742 RepID=A0ABD3AZL6_9GENT